MKFDWQASGNLAEELHMKLCSTSHSALLPEVTSSYRSQQRGTYICTSAITEQTLPSSHKIKTDQGGYEDCIKWLLVQVTIFFLAMLFLGTQYLAKMDNFFHCLQQGVPEQILAEISALSPAVNIAHRGVGERAILAQWES